MAEGAYRAVNLAGVRWVEDGRIAIFASSRPGYGVEVVTTGEILASDGVCPSAWRTKAAAAEIARYAEGMTHLRPVQVWWRSS